MLTNSINSRKLSKNDQFNEFLFIFFRIKYNLLTILKNLIRPFFKERHIRHKALTNIFPGFDKQEILLKIDKIEKITNTKIKCRFVNKNLIILTKAN